MWMVLTPSNCSPISAINSFKNFKVNQAKQFVACNHNGYVIGDAILFYLDENRFNLVGRPPAHNWVQYNLETRGYKASAERDERSAVNQGHRKAFRYQIQGPNALRVMEKVTGKPTPDIRFFNIGVLTIAGRNVRALRHGMVGQPGWELFGPWEYGDEVRNAIVEGGQELRDSTSRLSSLPHHLPRIGMDSISPSGDLCGRRDEGIPAVAEGNELRSHGLTRRQLLLERYHRLLSDSLRPWLRAFRQIRP